MPIKTGEYYIHAKGRMIAVLGKVQTHRWGEQFIIEEADRTGHGISCVDINTELSQDLWNPIGREEWLANFNSKVN